MPGPLLIGIEGAELDAPTRSLLRQPAVGGVVLFPRNYRSPEQLQALTAEIHSLREPPPLITVDQEGGPVQRFRDGFTRLPPPACLGAAYDLDPGTGRRLTRQAGWLMAAELRACGVDLSFAPVLDIDRGVSHVIGERALHSHPAAVALLGQAWLDGMRQGGMAAVGKHYPGHGGVAADSHLAQPVDPRSLAEIARLDLVPFQHLVASGLPGMMAAHVVYPEVDHRPAGFSPRWIRGILRGRLGFRGAVLSDDLGMQGAATAGTVAERVSAALTAGCDAALVCDPALAGEAIAAAGAWRGQDRGGRLARMRGQPAPERQALEASPAYQSAVQALTERVPGFRGAARPRHNQSGSGGE